MTGPFVIDASITLSWCFSTEITPYSRGVLDLLRQNYAIVPALWPFEVANALAVARRRDRITAAGIEEFLAYLQRLPIQIERRDAAWLWQATLPLTQQYRLSAYDAAYLELAKRERISLATLDDDLRGASMQSGVALLQAEVRP